MSFDSVPEFLAMGGHALYVWLSYGATLLVVLVNAASVRRARRRFLLEAVDRVRRYATATDSGRQTELEASSL